VGVIIEKLHTPYALHTRVLVEVITRISGIGWKKSPSWWGIPPISALNGFTLCIENMDLDIFSPTG
jgi:hypothetical protein